MTTLLTPNGSVIAGSAFRRAVLFRDAMWLVGDINYMVYGERLHLLLPFFMCGQVPRTLLCPSDDPFLPEIFPQPFPVIIREAIVGKPSPYQLFEGLGRALNYPVPKNHIRAFLIEAADFATTHQQEEFQFITPHPDEPVWFLKFRSQAYALGFACCEERDAFKDELLTFLSPNVPGPNALHCKNVFSVYADADVPSVARHGWHRCAFVVRWINLIPPDAVVTSCLSEMPSAFRKISLEDAEDICREPPEPDEPDEFGIN